MEVAPVPAVLTVLRARWKTEAACAGEAAFGAFAAEEDESGLDHDLLLVGLPSDTDVSVMLRCGEERASLEARTGALPSTLENLATEGEIPWPGFVLTTTIGAGGASVVYDAAGRVVWYHEDAEGRASSRARVVEGGVLYNVQAFGTDPAEGGEVVRVGWDGEVEGSTAIPLTTHDFVALPDGGLAAIVTDARTWEGVETLGDKIVEVSPDGASRDIWSTWDDYNPGDHPSLHLSGGGWSHANALLAADDSYWIGLRDFDSIVQVDRSTGERRAVWGGYDRTVEWAAPDDAWEGQHHFELLDDGIVVFDNRADRTQMSRVVRYELGGDVATPRTSWPLEAWIYALGDVDLREDWLRATLSTAGQLAAYDVEGRRLGALSSPLGVAFGYSEYLERIGP